ncbi:hypothetical protein BDBG_06552 [Blastomyces gilchristii SLH14081]|uniref:Uncharacterized protein n=1 Tax=Blastomyces gilchristii (strain SLH14081) TaxID=559298 RepID=A0A179UU38_BLAGS|nr:uncharacterized protein BDBG_06552 [Blastomyces gilchristii SLH14081]OAT10749.1 hypothetical protein BDBG_06552 [Blastomyces gilchristii SLH14081]
MAGVSKEFELSSKPPVEQAEIDKFNPSQLVSLIFYTERLPLYEKEKPFFLNFPPSEPGQRQSNVIYCRREVCITDVRGHEDLFTLDTTGFQYKDFETTVDYQSFASPAAIEGTFLKEVENFLTTELNADYVLAWDYQLLTECHRFGEEIQPYLPIIGANQGKHSHSDRFIVCPPPPSVSSIGSLSDSLIILSFWKPLVGPVEDAPLALCDYRTVAPEDRVPTDIVFPDYLGETYNFWANPKHRWYYMEGQLATEALIFKCFDSEAIINDKVAQC